MTTKNIKLGKRRESEVVKSSASTTQSILSGKKRPPNQLMQIARSRRFEIPSELINAAKANKLALLIGSGISKQANAKAFPTWYELLMELNSASKKLGVITADQHNEIRRMIRSGDFLMVGQVLTDALSKTQRSDFLRAKFQPPNVKHSELHEKLFELKPAVVLTTNYDTLLEDAYVSSTQNRDVTYTYEQSTEAHQYLSSRIPGSSPLIFKLHGCVSRPSRTILSEFDYKKLIYRAPSYRTLLSAIFVNYKVLILGYSLSDREINLNLEALQDSFDYSKKTDYIFLSAKGRSIFDAKSLAANFGVQPIWYNPVKKHREVLYFVNQFLKVLHTDK